MMNRRRFLAAAGVVVLRPGQDTTQSAPADRLYNAPAAGKARAPVGELDNSEMVKRLELQLKCTCPCNLDVFTCRTTDFTCEYSPAMHSEVMELVQAGNNSEEIIAAFVEKYGERVLMAPKPVGFNLAGYLVPGLLVLLAAVVLVMILLRRHRMAELALPGGSSAPAQPPPPPASSEEMERLNRALSEVAD